MEQPVIQCLRILSETTEIMWFFSRIEEGIVNVLPLLSMLFITIGFYMFRGLFSAAGFIAVACISFIYIEPAFGHHNAVTFCAIIGVVVAFVAFRFYKVAAVLVPCLIVADRMLRFGKFYEWPHNQTFQFLTIGVILMMISAYLFPLYSVYATTAFWGATVFLEEESFALYGYDFVLLGREYIIGAVILTIAGVLAQSHIFKKQKLFAESNYKRLMKRIKQR